MIKKYPDELINNILCTGCGTCRALCPVQAITMNENDGVYRPVIDGSKCTSCRICVDVCPVIDFWERDVEKKKKQIIFIETISRVTSKSASAKYIYPIADKFIIQWEKNPNIGDLYYEEKS
jgi:ferredoxin